jgi:hypothetical protein
MSVRKRRQEDKPGVVIPYHHFGTHRPKRDAAAAPDICSIPVEGIGLAFDPNRALLRRVFFLNEDRNKYVSLAFYPTQGYAAHVEFGAAKASPIRLTEQQFTVLAEHLPRLCDALCANEHYISGIHDAFWIMTGGSYRTAWMYLGLGKHNKHLVFKLSDLRYLNIIMYIVTNRLTIYNNAQSDVMSYAMSAIASTDYIEPLTTYSKNILYPQLYEDLKTLTLM